MSNDKDDNEPKKIFSILEGGKVAAEVPVGGANDPDAVPTNPYVIIDLDGEEHFAEGFLLFTSQHIAVMQDTPMGPVPALVFPLNMVKRAELLVEDDEASVELPF